MINEIRADDWEIMYNGLRADMAQAAKALERAVNVKCFGTTYDLSSAAYQCYASLISIRRHYPDL